MVLPLVLVADVGVVVVVAMLVRTALLLENWNSDTTSVIVTTPVAPPSLATWRAAR